ncbi:uncharacterized protein [Montipora capricornis]|uniref:uncharacterized protein n=1 Tax=Montipora capricornis TaxID=246305 RepID=UPI0035F1B58D
MPVILVKPIDTSPLASVNISPPTKKEELTQFLEVATTNQLFQFDGQLYEQTDGVAMGSPLGPLMANVFMCHLEDKLARDGMVPSLYKRYIDDTLARMPNTDAAADFLATLNGLHPSLKFTMELPSENTIPFIGIQIIKNGTELETRVYRKPTNTGLLFHFQSHVDKRYKTGLLKTMLHRVHALSSTTEAFNEECAKLRSIFSRLDYPIGLVNSTINMFILSKPEKKIDDGNAIRIVLPLKDQIAANAVRRQLRDLSRKICVTLQPIFVRKKLEQDLKPKEVKPSIVNRQCVVYEFACDLCDADYVGYTARHLHQRIAEHNMPPKQASKRRSSKSTTPAVAVKQQRSEDQSVSLPESTTPTPQFSPTVLGEIISTAISGPYSQPASAS